MRKCPKCGSRSTRRSHRREVERWLSALPIRPFRCRKCRRRFWRFEPPPPTADRLGSLLPLILAAATAGAVALYMTSLPYADEAPRTPPEAEAGARPDDPAAAPARRFGGVETLAIDDDRLRLKIVTGGPPASWSHFFLSRPGRIVVDLRGPWVLDRGRSRFLNHALVRAVRTDRLGDGVRVEIELGPAETAEPAFEEAADGLVVTFRRP